MKNKFWFVTGSQHLYGEETLRQVAEHSRIMVESFNADSRIPFEVVCCDTVKSTEEIIAVMERANADETCAGVITFMHTFSPSKMWISGLLRLNKPYCHLHTQFNAEIPFEDIDMDFMNLNQSAHGDREHGFIGARLRIPREIVVGYWENEEVRKGLADFMMSASGYLFARTLKVARFGDNMRQVAVTEGDKVEVELKLGISVNTHPVGDLVQYIHGVTDGDVNAEYEKCIALYALKTDDVPTVKEQLKYYIAMRKFFTEGGFGAFCNTFEDLHGMNQLPGLASQLLMRDGYGYGGEGDWKTSALVAIMKHMANNQETSFMEDYTYHLPRGNEMILGAHMLEVCPSIAADQPTIEVHLLGIGGKNPPARLKFNGKAGRAVCASMVDMGGRLRLIVTDVEAVPPIKPMPKLPVASVMWKPLPDLATAAKAWLLAGGAHHTSMSYIVDAQHLSTLAELWGIEFIHIGAHTDIHELKKELRWNDLYYKHMQ